MLGIRYDFFYEKKRKTGILSIKLGQPKIDT